MRTAYNSLVEVFEIYLFFFFTFSVKIMSGIAECGVGVCREQSGRSLNAERGKMPVKENIKVRKLFIFVYFISNSTLSSLKSIMDRFFNMMGVQWKSLHCFLIGYSVLIARLESDFSVLEGSRVQYENRVIFILG